MEEVEKLVSPRTAGMMLTVPNTLGLFESDVGRVAQVVHDAGGLMYYDGANMNALLGKARPGDMGFDIVHLNLHKTFATPHGGGGPGAGPVGVSEELEDYLPVPVVTKDRRRTYHLDYGVPHTIGQAEGELRQLGDPPEGVLLHQAAGGRTDWTTSRASPCWPQTTSSRSSTRRPTSSFRAKA